MIDIKTKEDALALRWLQSATTQDTDYPTYDALRGISICKDRCISSNGKLAFITKHTPTELSPGVYWVNGGKAIRKSPAQYECDKLDAIYPDIDRIDPRVTKDSYNQLYYTPYMEIDICVKQWRAFMQMFLSISDKGVCLKVKDGIVELTEDIETGISVAYADIGHDNCLNVVVFPEQLIKALEMQADTATMYFFKARFSKHAPFVIVSDDGMYEAIVMEGRR